MQACVLGGVCVLVCLQLILVTHSHQCEWHYKSWGIWLLDISSIPLSTIHLLLRGEEWSEGWERYTESQRWKEREREMVSSFTRWHLSKNILYRFVCEGNREYVSIPYEPDLDLPLRPYAVFRIPCLSVFTSVCDWLSLCVSTRLPMGLHAMWSLKAHTVKDASQVMT